MTKSEPVSDLIYMHLQIVKNVYHPVYMTIRGNNQ